MFVEVLSTVILLNFTATGLLQCVLTVEAASSHDRTRTGWSINAARSEDRWKSGTAEQM